MTRDDEADTDCEILFRSNTLLVRAGLGRGSDLCFVVFDPMVDDGSLERPAFGERFLAAYGYDAIHVLASSNGWYQDPGLPAALAAARAITRSYRRVVTYGSSMGGYAALRFADRVGAQAAVALSPQYSVLPPTVPFERRWPDQRDAVTWLYERPGDRLPALAEAVVFYDDRWLDGPQAAAILNDLPGATALPVPYAGHPVGTMLLETGVLVACILDAAHGRLDAAALRATLRQRRHRSGHYLLTLARRQPPWRRRLKARLAERAVAAAPGERVYHSYAGLALECVGRPVEALAHHAAATRRPGFGLGELRHARALWRSGLRGEARAAFERARAILRADTGLAEIGARMALVDGDMPEALRILASGPSGASRSLLGRLLMALGPRFGGGPMRRLAWAVARRQLGGTVLAPRHLLRELTIADLD